MIELDKDVVIKIIESIWVSEEKVINIDVFGLQCLKKEFPKASLLELNDIWDEIRKKVIHGVRLKIRRSYYKGVLSKYVFVDYSDVILIRQDIISKNAITQERNYLIIKFRKELKNALYKIKWRDFEFFCANLLRLYGGVDVGVTQKGKEGGIDFYGSLNLDLHEEYPSFSKLIEKLTIRIVGSAKRWRRKIGEAEIDKFIKKYRDLNSRKGRGMTKLPHNFLNQNSIIYALYITSSSFTRDARDQAKNNGIIIKNGEQAVEDLILISEPLSIKMWFKKDEERTIFNENAFIKWIEGLRNNF